MNSCSDISTTRPPTSLLERWIAAFTFWSGMS